MPGRILLRRSRLSLWIAFLIISIPSACAADDFQAKVIHIADGDTITVLNDANEQIKIRLNGIDCPEKAQAFGSKATQFTKRLAHKKTVTIQAYDQDKYGRTIGDVVLADGRNLSQELVKAGYAWWFFKYSDDEHLGALEAKAKIAKVGLWAEKNPVPPWKFRHRGESATFQSEKPSSSLAPATESSNSLPILGNKRSKKYHRPDCPSYHLIAPRNRVSFKSAPAAEGAGYKLAGNCPH